MSNRTKEINKITITVISISVKLIVYALIVLMLYEAMARGYAFGHEVFYAEAMEAVPGRDVTVYIEDEETVTEAAGILSDKGLIKSEFSFIFQGKFYDYETVYPGDYVLNTSMTSKEILQMLNEKPEEDEASPAHSGGTKARTAPETAAETAPDQGQPETGAPGGAPDRGQEGSGATDMPGGEGSGEESSDYYGEEEQEMEGGWIEDAAEDEAP